MALAMVREGKKTEEREKVVGLGVVETEKVERGEEGKAKEVGETVLAAEAWDFASSGCVGKVRDRAGQGLMVAACSWLQA